MPATQPKISTFFQKTVLKPVNRPTDVSLKRHSASTSPTKSPKKQKTLTTAPIASGNSRYSLKLAKYEQQFKGLLINFGESWLPALAEEFEKPYFTELYNFVAKERQSHTIYPKPEHVFSWTQACSLRDVKVVILGQDPYHGPNQAHGLCFSVMPGVPVPPSLVNMYKELETDIPGFKNPGHGYLMGWARQGVLLLNAVLTVRRSCANSHKDQGWEKVTDAVIQHLNKNLSGVVFMLWGAYAQKKGAHINKKKHCILRSVHPSPLSAHRGFLSCKHFSKANAYLKENGNAPIDWANLPDN